MTGTGQMTSLENVYELLLLPKEVILSLFTWDCILLESIHVFTHFGFLAHSHFSVVSLVPFQ